MTQLSRLCGGLVAGCLAASLGAFASAEDRVSIQLRPSPSAVQVGEIIDVRIFAVREPGSGTNTTGIGESLSMLGLYFQWNPLDLRLIGVNTGSDAEQLIESQLPVGAADRAGTNEASPPADGTGYYRALTLGNAVPVSTSGTLVSALRFEVLRPFVSSAVSPMAPFSYTFNGNSFVASSFVLDGVVGGYPTTGTLSGATIWQGPPCPADISGDRVVDAVDLSGLLAAWGTVESDANIIRDSSSPTVDGNDLGALLAAWGPCGS